MKPSIRAITLFAFTISAVALGCGVEAADSPPATEKQPLERAPELEALVGDEGSAHTLDDIRLQALAERAETSGSCMTEQITYPEGAEAKGTEATAVAACCGGFPPCTVEYTGCGWCWNSVFDYTGHIKKEYDANCTVKTTSWCDTVWPCGWHL